jgi:hypothetical protein
MNINELFWNSSIEDMKAGFRYLETDTCYVCLICGKSYEDGVITKIDEQFYDAKKSASIHVQLEHGPMFDYLIDLNPKYTGLSEIQKSLLIAFYQGKSDIEISKENYSGSTSTIRNHRFKLREREKQSKIFLSLMGLLEIKNKEVSPMMEIPKTTTIIDERFDITIEERNKVLESYIISGKLSVFPAREKKKVILLAYFANQFEIGKEYTEKEVNQIIKEIYDDYVTVRRYLIEYGYMDRLRDGSKYWMKV